MKDFSTKQNSVIEEARKRLKQYHWYRGVCLDDIPTDASILREGFEKAVQDVVLTTSFWDAPGFTGFPNKQQPKRTNP